MIRPRKFKLHFNRIAMQRGLHTVWTIHLSDRCIPCTQVDVNVPVTAVFRPDGPQPRAWMEGKGFFSCVEGTHWRIHLDG